MNTPIGQAVQIFVLGVVVLAGISLCTYQFSKNDGELAVLVCLAGAVGGIANNFRHLQHLAMINWEQLDSTKRRLMTLQIYVSPIIGALFAFVINLAFMAEIVQSAMFPQYNASGTFTTFKEFAENALPLTDLDVAKAIFWAFVAGFAEQFVPNFIDKVAKQAEDIPVATNDDVAK